MSLMKFTYQGLSNSKHEYDSLFVEIIRRQIIFLLIGKNHIGTNNDVCDEFHGSDPFMVTTKKLSRCFPLAEGNTLVFTVRPLC